MGARHDLPGDAWVELRDPESVTYRERRMVARPWNALQRTWAASAEPTEMPPALVGDPAAAGGFGVPPAAPPPQKVVVELSDADLDNIDALTEAGATLLIESWSFAIPTSQVLDLPGKTVDALLLVLIDAIAALFFDTSPTDDPESPTPPSAA